MIDFKLNKELVLSLVFFVLVILFGFWSLIALTPLVFVVLFRVFKNRGTTCEITLLDLAFVVLAISELLTVWFSAYGGSGEHTSYKLYVILFLYMAYRSYFKSEQKKILFSTSLFILTTLLAAITLIFFGLHYTNLLDNGFAELNNFKNLYNPLGIWNNLWACVLLLLLPFTMIFLLNQRKQKMKIWGILTLLLLVFGIVSSFSRGIYLSLAFFVAVFNLLIFRHIKLKKLLVINGLALGMLTLCILIVKDSVLTTMAFNKTVSQQRSTSGRIDRWEHALQLVKERPITGWGNGNFILARDTSPFVAEDAVFSSKIDNTYLQIMIEKGALGFIAYFLLFAVCTFIVFKGVKNKANTKKQKLELALIFSGLVAFLVRELTFSSLFVNNSVFFLVFHLVFFLIPYDIGLGKFKVPKITKHIFLLIGLTITFYLVYDRVEYAVLNNRNNQFIKTYYEDEGLEAFGFIEKALKTKSGNIILNKHKTILLSKNALQINISHRHPKLLKFDKVESDTLELSKRHLNVILSQNPNDDENLHNMGWVYLALNQVDSSKIYFKKSLELRPNNSTYLISKILTNLQNSDSANMKSDLTKVLRYSPDVLESPFYKEFSIKYPELALQSKKEAIIGLKKTLEHNDNPILKARLARLILEETPRKAQKLLQEVTEALPNLYRTWAYLAYLEEDKDTTRAKELYKKAVFLSDGDFLPKLYQARFLGKIGNDKKSVGLYKEALQAYGFITSDSYKKNRVISSLRTITNSYIPNDLLYYTNPSIPYQEIFKYFIDYYGNMGDTKTSEFYQNLVEKYATEIYKGRERLR